MTSDDDVIRNIIAFAGSDLQLELQNEMTWVGDFPMPLPKPEKCSSNDDINGAFGGQNEDKLEIHGSELANEDDALLGNLLFEVIVSNTIIILFHKIIEIEIHIILTLYLQGEW